MRLQEKLDLARRELLDLTLRNPLLNYRTLKKRGLDIAHEKSMEIYRLLVDEGKTMSFLCDKALLPKEEETPEHLELLQQTYSDLKLQTLYNEKELQDRLLNTHLTAKTFIEERGVNTLFLALGMLIWEEESSKDRQYRAPLVLIPVSLERSNARERFVLTYSDEDIQLNVSLAAKLMADFHLQLNVELEDIEPVEYFQHVREAIVSQPSWRVAEDDIALGFFSFGKYLMYLDLDASRWPENTPIVNNEILKSVLVSGFEEQQSQIADNAYIDPYLLPKETYQVVDSDSSQTLAILDINAGRNLVIQGPPGTGKSQTITNVIAESVARGKKVLFVSEKLAALEVVQRRLTNIGLGDVCLELHSQKANKKELLSELQKTMELGIPKVSELENQYNEYIRLREELTRYCTCINEPVYPSGLTPIRIYGKLIALDKKARELGSALPRVSLLDIGQWNDVEYESKMLKVKELQKHLNKMGVPARHPFTGTELKVVLPAQKEMIHSKIKNMRQCLENLLFVVDEIGAVLGWNAVNRKDAQRLVNTLEYSMKRPDLTGVVVNHARWAQEGERIIKLTVDGLRMKEIFACYQSLLMDEIYGQDVLSARQKLAANCGKFFKFLSSEYRNASKFVEGFFKAPQKINDQKKIAILDDVLEFNRLRNSIDSILPLYQELFTVNARGNWETDWSFVNRASEFIVGLHEGIQSNEYAAEILPHMQNTGTMEQAARLLPALKDHLLQFTSSVRQFYTEARMKEGQGMDEETDEFSALQERIDIFEEGIDTIYDYAVFNQYCEDLSSLGLQELVELCRVWRQACEFLSDIVENERCQALLNKAFQERPELTRFDSSQHHHKITRFIALDVLFMQHNISRLLLEHYTNKPKPGQGSLGQMGVLMREFQKKTRHMPIRKLMTRAGNVIQALKPVMMMSPLSIANFIEPGQLSFDIVIFDEASQVRPVEAFGALMRSAQAVVVGDSQQMPPTDFFDRAIGSMDENEEDDYIGDVESILGLFLAQNAPQRMLRWHYRSRHESLIAVSNREFYKNKLVVFPSSVHSTESMGLVFHSLTNTVYDRGNTQTNREEARVVAEHVMRHAKERPELTLGVAAFSIQQMQAIIDQLEVLRRKDPSCEHFFHSHKEEPFFVKNLENVQGDERDIIYISIGYGRDKDGALTMSFGPLNRDGGERRLNVLITRARLKCEVFSGLTGADIDLSRTSSRGVACLKAFLTYAEKGILDVKKESEGEACSEFEQQVHDMLVKKGYTVKQRVGSADFYIDLAVVHPEDPGRYLVGIECDGAAYVSARSARDRDRLRHSALERKGWHIYRIWSTDWFKSPNTEMAKLEQYMQGVLHGGVAAENRTFEVKHGPVIVEREELQPVQEQPAVSVEPYRLYQGKDVNDELIYQPAFLSRLIYDIVSVENPLHKDELVRRVLGLSGLTRAGSRIQNAFEVAISSNVRRGTIEERGSFLYCMDKPIQLRTRNELPAASRKIEYVAPEEIAMAVKTVIKSCFGMHWQEIPSSASRVLGFARTTEEMMQRVSEIVRQMEQMDEIKRQGDTYIVA